MPTEPQEGDEDGDGVATAHEVYVIGTDPSNPDTDGDGLLDSEVFAHLNPLSADTDGDMISDGQELIDGSSPLTPDRGFDAGPNAGTYAGSLEFASDFLYVVRDDGTAVGRANVDFLTVGFFGGVDPQGNIQLLSFDYFYSIRGTIGDGAASGTFETAGGFAGTWSAALVPIDALPPNCTDTCDSAFNWRCDAREENTDCFDCNLADQDCLLRFQDQCIFAIDDACADTCALANDDQCDDGRKGAVGFDCDLGTDCSDCGPLFPVKVRDAGAAATRSVMELYQPVRGERQPLNHPVHQRVDWRAARSR